MINKNNPELGFLTKKVRNEYIIDMIKNDKFDLDKIDSAMSLYASSDKNEKIYFWQLYSILGDKPIIYLIKKFYENVFNDEGAEWFRNEFIDLGDIDYHVKGQGNFWLDVMGGGQRYLRGEKMMYKKHKLVKNIMTREGGERWMYNMEKTLSEIVLTPEFEDKRILVCIYDFLEYYMNKYAVDFDFNVFDLEPIKKRVLLKSII